MLWSCRQTPTTSRTGQHEAKAQIADDFIVQRIKDGSGICLQDNRAVGNSRLAHMDVLSVSCKQIPEPSPRHSLYREQGSLLHTPQ